MIKRLIAKYYNQTIEDIATRILYFFNTLDTYFLVAGAISFVLSGVADYQVFVFLIISVSVWVVFKISDFYFPFLLFGPLYLFFLFKGGFISKAQGGLILLINLGLFILIQFLFMGIPEAIVARDISVALRKIKHSLFTLAPTLVSLPVSVYFSTLYSLILAARPNPLTQKGLLFWLTLSISSVITHRLKPKSFISSNLLPEIKEEIAEKVIVLNIDGCRLDRFYEAKLSFLTNLEKESTYFPQGLHTVYRALTNPAFASMLSGATPQVHGIKSNNLGGVIRVEALPDLVKTKLYGSMHIKHFSKNTWETRIVSLPTHSIYKSDEIMFDWLKEDLLKSNGCRLFIADISEVDFLGHAYSSESRQYLEALKRADQRIEQFFAWLRKEEILKDAVAIILSDHGIIRTDHSYLLFAAEKYVPCIITGKRIKPNNPLSFAASIMDIAPTISYLLGIRYPSSCKGRVFLEAITAEDKA